MNQHGYKLTILEVYAVNDDAPVNVKDQFFEKLNDEIVKVGTTRELIVLGNLNGRTGKKQNDKVVGRYGEETTNNNGERIITICEQNQLKILNGYFQHKEIHQYTWTQETRGLKSIIDYVIIRQISRINILDVRAYRGISCGSDHYFLGSKLSLLHKKNVKEENIEEKEEKIEETRYNLSSLEQY